MSRIDNEIRITPSVLDRLLDFEPDVSREAPKSRSKSLRELKLSVRRDLEWLLNTRTVHVEIDERLEEIRKSVLTYGLPDITGISAKNQSEQKRLSKAIESAIRYFEPRFLDVRVTLEPLNNVDRALKFRIEARLNIEPTPEPIAFDTILQLGSGEFEVKEK
ncbi:MAG: type VI secretion system baseplate subunit TssE [Acidobacteria bacterium]|nr:type VI secretion system baseplate subunit TssE [Acidobacteriota bacterium]MBK8148828.1 type VI secretion system baseplate subunit TssE [Acidobacteriota bacterium]MBK8810126.1 type VI secretion system baseplate subunit TssE [Acidobacteriota bacterium]